jgi:hypothetical protein
MVLRLSISGGRTDWRATQHANVSRCLAPFSGVLPLPAQDFAPAGANATFEDVRSSSGHIFDLVGNHTKLRCTSGEMYNALFSVSDVFSHADTTITSRVIFSALTIVGVGLLVFGALFEQLAIGVALAVVLFTSTFVATYALVADGGHIRLSTGVGQGPDLDMSSLCDGPLVVAIVTTVLAILAALCIGCIFQRCSWRTQFEQLVKFVVGFAVGGIVMLVVFQQLEMSSAALTQRADCGALFTYVGFSVVVALMMGGVSVCGSRPAIELGT